MKKELEIIESMVNSLQCLDGISQITRVMTFVNHKSQEIIASKMQGKEAEIAAMDKLINEHKDKLNNEIHLEA